MASFQLNFLLFLVLCFNLAFSNIVTRDTSSEEVAILETVEGSPELDKTEDKTIEEGEGAEKFEATPTKPLDKHFYPQHFPPFPKHHAQKTDKSNIGAIGGFVVPKGPSNHVKGEYLKPSGTDEFSYGIKYLRKKYGPILMQPVFG